MDKYNLEFFKKALESLPANTFFKDKDARYIYSSHYWRHLNVGGDDWDICGKTDLEIRKDKENAKFAYEQDKKIIETKKGVKYTIKIDQDNFTEYFEITKEPVFDDMGNVIGIAGMIYDVTDKIKAKDNLIIGATNDSLTGLYNRYYLDYWLLNKNNASLYPMSIIFADCNGLKEINDTYGHNAGDEYLKLTAALLKIGLQSDSLVFRVGGDEFIALLPNTKKEQATEYVSKLQTLGSLNGNNIDVAYGISTIPVYQENIDKYINEADKRMYVEKEKWHKEKEYKKKKL